MYKDRLLAPPRNSIRKGYFRTPGNLQGWVFGGQKLRKAGPTGRAVRPKTSTLSHRRGALRRSDRKRECNHACKR